MPFEHEQFQRFLQHDDNFHGNWHDSTPPPSLGAKTQMPPGRQQRKVVTISSSSCGQLIPPQRRQMVLMGRHWDGGAPTIKWNAGCCRAHGHGRGWNGMEASGRMALWVVSFQLSLLCAWLIHELASGFDESQCLFINSFSSPMRVSTRPFLPEERQQIGNSNNNNNIADIKSAVQTKSTAVAKNAAPALHKYDDNDDAGGGGIGMGSRRRADLPTSTAARIHQRQPTVPKKRRKVILRRRLLRKGATAGTTANSDRQNSGADPGPGHTGAIRRVVWRVVPLRKLPSSPSSSQSDSANELSDGLSGGADSPDGQMPEGEDGPEQRVRTKTGIVLLRTDRSDAGANLDHRQQREQRRRVVRRKILLQRQGEDKGESSRMDASSGGGRTERANMDSTTQTGGSRRPLGDAHHFAAAALPGQLGVLVSGIFCYARTVFDFWCLLQCCCSAMFLLALHLRHRLLAFLPVLVNVVSILLALIFGISTLLFPLILLLWLPSVHLPARSLLQCLGLSALVHVGIALFAWCTFVQLRAMKMENTAGRNGLIVAEKGAKGNSREGNV